jgi:hypothetical protein
LVYEASRALAETVQTKNTAGGRVASLALKEPNFLILASFDFVWLLKISFGFFLFFGSFWLLFE